MEVQGLWRQLGDIVRLDSGYAILEVSENMLSVVAAKGTSDGEAQ